MHYHNFDEILFISPVNDNERIIYMRRWLNENYDIKDVNAQWVDVASTVHNHDNLQQHFGSVEIGSAFMAFDTALVKVGETWHIAMVKKGTDETLLIHPRSESSFSHPDNQKLLLSLRNVLKTGTVRLNAHNLNAVSKNSTPVIAPATAVNPVDALPADIYADIDAQNAVEEDVVSVSPDTYSTGSTRSVGIDMSKYF